MCQVRYNTVALANHNKYTRVSAIWQFLTEVQYVTRALMIIDEAPGSAAGQECWWDCMVLPEFGSLL
jgi:hypothetical protein